MKIGPVVIVADLVKKLQDLQAVQKENLTDPYLVGLHNGVELALSVIEDRAPVYESTRVKYPPRRNLYDVHHTDDIALVRFALCMRDKLEVARTRGRSGWEMARGEYLTQLLYEHLEKGDPVDVANFCMFLHQRGDRIFPVSPHVGQWIGALNEIRRRLAPDIVLDMKDPQATARRIIEQYRGDGK